jgi:hypothetical protein
MVRRVPEMVSGGGPFTIRAKTTCAGLRQTVSSCLSLGIPGSVGVHVRHILVLIFPLFCGVSPIHRVIAVALGSVVLRWRHGQDNSDEAEPLEDG